MYSDTNEFYNETKIKKSRKAHKCECCWGEIPIGSSYVKGVGKNSDGIFEVKMHNQCHEIMLEEVKNAGEPICFNDVYENVCDWRKNPENLLHRLELMKSIPSPSKAMVRWIKILEKNLGVQVG